MRHQRASLFKPTATAEIYTLSLHDALPISNSRNPASPTPSAQRTGAPTARSRSSSSTSSSGAARFASHAATAPAGPAPTTNTSTSGIGHRERAHGAGRDAFPAPRAARAVDHQVVQLEVNGFRRTQR